MHIIRANAQPRNKERKYDTERSFQKQNVYIYVYEYIIMLPRYIYAYIHFKIVNKVRINITRANPALKNANHRNRDFICQIQI